MTNTYIYIYTLCVYDRLSLFSSNEELEDVQTRSLRYLLLPFIKAEVLQEYDDGQGGDANASSLYPSRLAALEAAHCELQRFLALNDRMGVLDEPTKLTYLREGPVDAATRRAEKVARFTREKALRQKLQRIREAGRKRALRSGDDEHTRDDGDDEDDDDDAEGEDEREEWMIQLRLAHTSAIDAIAMLDLETEMLRMRAASSSSSTAEGRPSETKTADERARRAAPTGRKVFTIPAVGSAAATVPPGMRFPIEDDRARIAASIFRPSHVLPTKTLEQFADEEIADARARDERQRNAAAREEARKAAMTEEEREDEEVYKARNWDEFKDDNPTGWGNSKLRPCA